MLVSCSARPRWWASSRPGASSMPKIAHRQPPDRAGDAVAIEIERRASAARISRVDVHLHAVDDGEEVVALAGRSGARRRPGTPPAPAVAAGVERVEIGAPVRRARRRGSARSPCCRRRCRRPRGRRRRSRTSPRARPWAAGACRRRTSCRRPAPAARPGLARRASWRLIGRRERAEAAPTPAREQPAPRPCA